MRSWNKINLPGMIQFSRCEKDPYTIPAETPVLAHFFAPKPGFLKKYFYFVQIAQKSYFFPSICFSSPRFFGTGLSS